MAQGDVLFREHGIMGVVHTDLQQDYDRREDGRADEGQIAWSRDSFGALRMFTFRQNVSGSAFAVGDLTSKKRTVITNIDGGATTSVTESFTANELPGALLMVHDNGSSAGAAPEGEATIIAGGTTTVATFETALPLSAALAANDDVTILYKKVIDAADGDFDHVVCGIAMAAVSDDNFGWFQFQGIHPAASHKSNTAATVGEPIVADAATVNIWGSDAANLWVGRQLATHAADVGTTGDKSAVLMSLLPVYC